MKHDLAARIHKKMTLQDKFYGTATIGARGQVVIPVEARADLKLKPGDQLLVMGKFGKVLGMIKASDLGEFVKVIMGNLAGSGLEKDLKKHLEQVFGKTKLVK